MSSIPPSADPLPLHPVDAHVHGPVDRSRVLALRSVHLWEVSETLESDTGPICVGLHPWHVRADSWSNDLLRLEKLLATGRFLALGEAGIDRAHPPDVALQRGAFLAQIELSERFGLPLVVHCVHSASDLLEARRTTGARRPWILHGWNGSPAQTDDLLEKTDFVLSFGASLLRPGSKARTSLAIVPDDRLLLETDTATIAIESIELAAAGLRGTTPADLRARFHANWRALFA